MTRIFLLLISLAALSGCSTVGNLFGMNSSVSRLPQINEAFNPLVLWEEDAGSMGDAVLVPAVDHGAIFVASQDGEISRLESLKGRRLWKVDTLHKISAGVGVGDGLVIVGADNGEVMAFDESGKPKWKFQIAGELLSPPQAEDGIVVVRTGDGRIFGLDGSDGRQKWVYQYTVPALSIRNYAGVRISQGTVFAGFAGGKLVALDLKTGALGWEAAVAQPHGTTELERIADVASLPVIDELQVCAVAFQGRLSCFDIAKGDLIWSRDISSDTGMIVDRRNIFMSDEQGAVLSLDSTAGASVWKQTALEGRRITAPYVQDNYVVVGDIQGYVHFMRRSDGELVARIKTDGSAIRSQPIHLDSDVFLVQTGKGKLYALAVP